MSIIINTVFFAIIYLEAVASLNAILFSHACALFTLVAFCDEKGIYYYIISKWHFLHNCTYLTFDLTLTLNQKITLGIYPCVVCNSPRNSSSLDAKHQQKCHQETS